MGIIYKPPSFLSDLSDGITQAFASISLQASRAVIQNSFGLLEYASSNIQSHAYQFAGILISSINANELGIAYRIGEVTDSTWNWNKGNPVFLGSNGFLTQIPPTTGFVLSIGKPLSSNTLFIELSEPIFLGSTINNNLNLLAPANGQIPIGNGTNFNLSTITPGTGVSITNSPGAITISSDPTAQLIDGGNF